MASRLDLLREKILLQYERVSSKFKIERSKELTNQDIQIALYQLASSGNSKNEYDEKNFEWLSDRLVRLTIDEMAVIKKRYWEAKSFVIIANECGHIGNHKWASRMLDEALDKLREA